MSKITDYSFLFQSMFGTKSNAGVVNPLKVSDLSNGSLRSQLKAAGIDTNSAQYKAAVKCNAALYSRRKKHFIFDSINTITAPSFR